MLHYLAMNVTQSLNFFLTKEEYHYILHIILSRRYWDYNKHFQVEFSACVQAPHVNDTKNKNILRTLYGIYLCPAPNFQGGHQIMDLRTRKFITIPKLVEIPLTDIVINAVEKWRRSRNLIHFRIIVKRNKSFFPGVNLAGLDHQHQIDQI